VDRDFDAEIKEARAEIEQLKPQMAAALDAWLDTAAPWAADFWTRAVAAAVQASPAAVKGLGDAGRKSVKAETTAFIDNARPYLQRRLVDEQRDKWPHLKPQTSSSDEYFRPNGPGSAFSAGIRNVGGKQPYRSIPQLVDHRLSRVLGEIAQILAPHDFELSGFKSSGAYGGGWQVDPYDRRDWSDEMILAMGTYGELHKQYVAALRRIEETSAAKERAEASDLWGDA
jgi:hypothetical protein